MPVTSRMLWAKRKRKAYAQPAYRAQKKATYTAPIVRPMSKFSSRTGFGNRKTIKMIYSEKFNLGGALLGAPSVYQFRLNSIYDPNYTGTGHQPTTHDQMALIFENYCVTDVRYKISMVNTENTVAGLVAIQVTDVVDAVGNITTLIEQGQCEWRPLGVLNGDYGVAVFTGQVDIPKLHGKPRAQYMDDAANISSFGASPVDLSYLNIYLSEASTGTAPVAICTIEMEFTVLMTGSAVVPQS